MDDRILDYAQHADEIWHCGDFGDMEVIKKLQNCAPVKGVFGNIDDAKIRTVFPESLTFRTENVTVSMLHIGGYPGKYTPLAKKIIEENHPKIFISGHSHILKAMFDEKNQLLHLNPGAAGKTGWHKVRTMMRFEIDNTEIKNLEIIELGAR